MAREHSERILIVGAGMAGLTLARTLADAGAAVTVAEKGRAIGGRMASRATDFGTFDHGAQYVTGKSGPFRALLTGLSHDGTAAFWKPAGRDRTLEWHVGMPAMNRMLEPMQGGFDLRLSTTVTRLDRAGEGFSAETRAHGADGPLEPETFDRALLCVPAPQAKALVSDLDTMAERLDEASYGPCWTLMLAFDQRLETNGDVFRADPGDPSPIAWAARNSSKPGRAEAHDLWIANAGPGWSLEHLELSKEEVIEPLLEAFAERVGVDVPAPVHAATHRWRYSLVERPLGEPFLMSEDGRLAACGDWCIAGRVEAAFESARRLANAVKERL